MDRALAAQDKGIEVCKLFGMGQMHGVLKAATGYRLGLDCGAPRPPGLPLTPDQDRAVRDHMAKLDLLPADSAAAE
jgi:dihydrodipicolinate synthase/N-acetylneuraminate lyase